MTALNLNSNVRHCLSEKLTCARNARFLQHDMFDNQSSESKKSVTDDKLNYFADSIDNFPKTHLQWQTGNTS